MNIGKGWETHLWIKICKGHTIPDWLSIKPSKDGSYDVMTDPMVKEMLEAVASRLPNYDKHKLKYFNQKEPHTLIHGDLHQGNHLCGTGANEGKVIAVDFQVFGKGLICVELVYLLTSMELLKSYEEYEEFLRGRFYKLQVNFIFFLKINYFYYFMAQNITMHYFKME